MRDVLNLALFMALYIDCASRGADIAWSSRSAETTECCVVWEDVDWFAFTVPDGGIGLRAKITIKWQKGMRLRSDLYKIIPLHFLGPELAAQDSLFLLFVLALIDNLFGENIRSWNDIQALRPGPDGARIDTRPSLHKLAIFRGVENRNKTVLTYPAGLDKLRAQLTRLGDATGFEDRLTPYALRRGMAFQLHENVRAEDKRFIIRHRNDSKVWSSYESKVITVDTAGIFRELDPSRQVSSRPLMRIALNRKSSLPTTISRKGWEEDVCQDAELERLSEELERLKEPMVDRDGDVAKAKRAGHPNAGRYV